MIIRSFIADTMAAALKDVRMQMGGAAVVLKTRQVETRDGRGRFEVTACLDNPTAAQASQALPDNAPAAVNRIANVATEQPAARTAVAEAIESETTAPETREGVAVPVLSEDLADRIAAIERQVQRLVATGDLASFGIDTDLSAISEAVRKFREADVPEFFIHDFLTSLRSALSGATITPEVIRSALRDRLSIALGGGIELKPGDRVLVMGPAGCGKTSIVGKLAHSLVTARHIPVRLQTLDSIKVGALDEIQSLGDVLGVEVSDPTTMMDLAKAARREEDADKVVLIDSGAMPATEEKFNEFKQAVESVAATHRLAVYSALTRSGDIGRQAEQLSALKPTHTVLTMLDLTNHWGAMFAATEIGGTKLSLIADSPSGGSSLRPPVADSFLDNLLGQETTEEVSHG